jgi:hypothetical protein
MDEPKEFLDKVRRVTSGKLKYPIHNFRQLADALGGENAMVTWEGRAVPIGQARKLLPDDYFPIESEEDLHVIAVNLEMLRPGNSLTTAARGQERPPSPDRKPPSRPVDDPEFRERMKGRRGGLAQFKGFGPE